MGTQAGEGARNLFPDGMVVGVPASEHWLAVIETRERVADRTVPVNCAAAFELDRVRARIDAAKTSSLQGDSKAVSEASLLAGLIAYESRIDSVREWPFGASTPVRFGTLSPLTVRSRLGGATVERVLGAILE